MAGRPDTDESGQHETVVEQVFADARSARPIAINGGQIAEIIGNEKIPHFHGLPFFLNIRFITTLATISPVTLTVASISWSRADLM